MRDRFAFLIATTVAGFLTLSLFSILQRLILGLGFMTTPKAYIVPFVYGGSIGFLLGVRQLRIRRTEAELQAKVNALREQSVELQATEETLRRRIAEYDATHLRLVASERDLKDKNDELVATEEMLREQIEENEAYQRELRESNQNLQTLFDVSPLAMLISTYPDDRIIEVNRKFCEDFGCAASEVIGKRSEAAGIWGDAGTVKSFPDLLGDLKEVSGLGAVLKTGRGANLEVLVSSKVIEYKGKICLFSVCLDITEQKKMEEILRQTQKMEAIGQLAGGVAHDFNNMLAAIIGSADLLGSHVRDDAKALSYIATILEAASRSADLTRQLLAFSRKAKKELVPLCVNEEIRGVVRMLERTIDKSITVDARLEAKKSVIVGDPTLLKNALLNLGVNARDAMPDGGAITIATRDVKIEGESSGLYGCRMEPGEYLEISVADTGVGMTKEVAERVFEPFFTTKEAGKGTGLGLAAVFATVKDHRGCITLQSEPGDGATFRIYLPLSEKRRMVVSQEETVLRGSGGILLVDDEALIRHSGKEMLEDLGYRVFLAQDGEQALEVYRRERDSISLVILDMVMPKLGGEKTLAQFGARFPEAKILLSSGREWGGTAGGDGKSPAHGFILKPYRKADLCKAISAALGAGLVDCGN